ncbi:MAG: NADH:flavin oxidoreductase [Burkholderiales bacterium]|nr:NADH:flavin oxidoreductase [Burkholderiales bacterium]
MKFGEYPKLGSIRSVGAFKDYLGGIGIDMPCDEVVEHGSGSPLAKSLNVAGFTVGNRFAVNPMEGWDGETDGTPSPNTVRRWQRFGDSGAKLVWGGEAVAVRHDGRANPNQLILTSSTKGAIAGLRETLVASHRQAMGDDNGLLIGLQLTHSGRFCKPNDHKRFEPMIAYRHPLLDRKYRVPDDWPLMSDDDIKRLVDDFVLAASLAHACGFHFVDVKHCHGYLGHELLTAVDRPGRYGGSFENRTRFMREIIEGIRAEAPGLAIGVRLSAVDFVPFRPDPALSSPGALGPGIPEDVTLPYRYAFGANPNAPDTVDLAEPLALLAMLDAMDVTLINITAGSPYYTPHLIRPAIYPPSDGYAPPEEPLAGVMRHIALVRDLKAKFPRLCLVGSGYTYLQEYLPNVAQAVIRLGMADSIGLGRMMLSYPELARDVLEGRPFRKKLVCRTFSDCTTAPRNGIVSGCYPLDPHYKKSSEAKLLAAVKKPAA